MSLSQPKLSNPCKKFIEFKSGEGCFQYWDKQAEKNVKLSFPIKFIVLDELSTVSGYSEANQSRIYANEVRNLKDQDLNVRTFKGKLSIIGKYADIKAEVVEAGAKYTKSVYAALLNGNDMELVNFQLKASSFSSWMDKEVDVSSAGIVINRCDEMKKGNVKYKSPVYEGFGIDQEQMSRAVAMDKDLQAFLGSYLKKQDEAIQADAKEEDRELDEPNPF